MVHIAVGDDVHPHGQGGGGSTFVLELIGDANRGYGIKGGGRTTAAPRPRRLHTLVGTLEEEAPPGADVEKRHTWI